MQTITNIAVHHTGAIGTDRLASSQHLSFLDVNTAHRVRWPNFTSTLGLNGGYNFYIDASGSLFQYRAIGEETAAQLTHNQDTVSICLAGNFTMRPDGRPVNSPTKAQIDKLTEVLNALLNKEYAKINAKIVSGTVINLSISRIYAHRSMSGNATSCYGDLLANDWAMRLVMDSQEINSIIQQITLLLARLQTLIAASKTKLGLSPKFGADDRDCPGFI